MTDVGPSGFFESWERERRFRLADLTSKHAMAELKANAAAWGRLIAEFGPRRPAGHLVHVPLALLQMDTWQGRVITSRADPTGSSAASVVTTLANGGADGLVLRLFLVLWAARDMCDPARVTELESIPLLDRVKGKDRYTWQSLTRVGPSIRADPSRPATRDQTRRRITRAVHRLEYLGLVTVHRDHLGRIVGIRLNADPSPVPVELRGGCSDVYLPLAYWLSGWNALLWADDIVNLLMLLAGPTTTVYLRYLRTLGYRQAGMTLRPPANLTPRQFRKSGSADRESLLNWLVDDEGDAYEAMEKPAVFVSERRRVQQFGVHSNRYTKVADLVDFGLVSVAFTSRRPNWKARAERAALPGGPIDADVRRAEGSTRAFYRHPEGFAHNAVDAMGHALVRVEPLDLTYSLPHNDSLPSFPAADTAFAEWLAGLSNNEEGEAGLSAL